VKTTTLKLWLVLCASLGALLLSALTGFAQDVFQLDHSHLTVVIVVLYFLCSAALINTVRTHNWDPHVAHDTLKPYWFASELFFGLGIIGNLMGMYLMLKGFVGLNMADAAAVQALMPQAIAGLGTACLVTMIGVICSFALKYQLVQVEQGAGSQS
jgi:drug/metabolite transporter (DMT)-like permease